MFAHHVFCSPADRRTTRLQRRTPPNRAQFAPSSRFGECREFLRSGRSAASGALELAHTGPGIIFRIAGRRNRMLLGSSRRKWRRNPPDCRARAKRPWSRQHKSKNSTCAANPASRRGSPPSVGIARGRAEAVGVAGFSGAGSGQVSAGKPSPWSMATNPLASRRMGRRARAPLESALPWPSSTCCAFACVAARYPALLHATIDRLDQMGHGGLLGPDGTGDFKVFTTCRGTPGGRNKEPA